MILDNLKRQEENLFILNFASRLLITSNNPELLFERALETFADFAQSGRVGLVTLDDVGEGATSRGVFDKNEYSPLNLAVPLVPEVKKILLDKRETLAGLAPGFTLHPLPRGPADPEKPACLYLPLAAHSGLVLGGICIELAPGRVLDAEETSHLRMLAAVTAISLENCRLFAMAMIDGLTGLYVRRYYEHRMSEETSKLKRHPGSLSLLLFDLDHFKRVNDQWGHSVGDDVLKSFARLLKSNSRVNIDIPCRHGGEEFALIMPETTREEAVAAAERIREDAARLNFPGLTPKLKITVSIGLASTSHPAPAAPETLFERSDSMLYQAKNSGRNRVAVWPE